MTGDRGRECCKSSQLQRWCGRLIADGHCLVEERGRCGRPWFQVIVGCRLYKCNEAGIDKANMAASRRKEL